MSKDIEHEYKVYLNNLTSFVKTFERTSYVNFLYFVLDSSKLPKIRTCLGKWEGIGDQIHYIGHGIDKNYVYVYKESDLKVLIEIAYTSIEPNNAKKSRENFGVYNVRILGPPGPSYTTESTTAFIGHHIDYSIHKNGKDIFVKLHKTVYTYDDYNNTFVREAAHCNFNLHSRINSRMTKTEFAQMRCVNKIGPTDQTIQSTFHTDDDDVIVSHQLLANTLVNKTEPRSTVSNHVGGGVNYHDITFSNDEFIKFIHSFLLRPTKRRRPDIVSAEVIYDAHAEISPYGPKSFLIMYGFENGNMDIFHIDMMMALKACYVETSNNQKFTKDEMKCHAYFKNIKDA